jgi:hypothetical protein
MALKHEFKGLFPALTSVREGKAKRQKGRD